MIKSIWHTKNSTEIRTSNEGLSDLQTTKVISKYSMISLGTERLVLKNQVPPTIHQYMKIPYMKGDFNLPIKYGYSVAGILEDGKKAHLMHPHQNMCLVKKESIFTECDNLPLQRIPLISNIETVINAIWDSEIIQEENKQIIVCGFGNIGSLLATTLKHHFKKEVKIKEANEWRKQKAKDLGFEIINENKVNFDVAFNTTANEKALQFCINNSNEEAKIIELSWFGTSKVSLDLGSNFHKNRLRLIASQVSKIPIKYQQEYNYYKRKKLAVKILNNKAFDSLITNVIPFDEAPVFFNKVRKNTTPSGIIYLIKY